MSRPVSAIIVTHNSAGVLPHCLEALGRQSMPANRIVIVDSGSTEREYLETLRKKDGLILLEAENIGFGQANNLGMSAIPPEPGTVLFLNPDTFLHSDFIANCCRILEKNLQIGVITGKMLGYDPVHGKPTGKLDSTGIFRKWYGRWYDRGQGETDAGRYDASSEVPAVCGALMCCRTEALMSLGGGAVFDKEFFLYKEDIELSLRLRDKGWQLVYDPTLLAYHCRGWQKDRQLIPHSLRCMAAWNEVLLYKKHPSPYIVWAIFKHLLVKYLRV